MILIGLLMLASVIFPTSDDNEFPLFNLWIGLFCIIGLPIIIYYSARKNYYANPRIGETIVYKFDREVVHVKGESFESTYTWEKVYRITETGSWFLIWQNKQVANIVPKKNFSPEQLVKFNIFLKEHIVRKGK